MNTPTGRVGCKNIAESHSEARTTECGKQDHPPACTLPKLRRHHKAQECHSLPNCAIKPIPEETNVSSTSKKAVSDCVNLGSSDCMTVKNEVRNTSLQTQELETSDIGACHSCLFFSPLNGIVLLGTSSSF